jgi:hypothetical protein
VYVCVHSLHLCQRTCARVCVYVLVFFFGSFLFVHVCMYQRMHAYMHLRTYLYMYVCMHVYMYVCMYARIEKSIFSDSYFCSVVELIRVFFRPLKTEPETKPCTVHRAAPGLPKLDPTTEHAWARPSIVYVDVFMYASVCQVTDASSCHAALLFALVVSLFYKVHSLGSGAFNSFDLVCTRLLDPFHTKNDES